MDFVCLGFIDIFSESKEGLGAHSSMILRFLHRNRLSSVVIPYPMLDHCNNMCTMRASVLKESLDELVQKEKGMCMWGEVLKILSSFLSNVVFSNRWATPSPCRYLLKCNSDIRMSSAHPFFLFPSLPSSLHPSLLFFLPSFLTHWFLVIQVSAQMGLQEGLSSSSGHCCFCRSSGLNSTYRHLKF